MIVHTQTDRHTHTHTNTHIPPPLSGENYWVGRSSEKEVQNTEKNNYRVKWKLRWPHSLAWRIKVHFSYKSDCVSCNLNLVLASTSSDGWISLRNTAVLKFTRVSCNLNLVLASTSSDGWISLRNTADSKFTRFLSECTQRAITNSLSFNSNTSWWGIVSFSYNIVLVFSTVVNLWNFDIIYKL